MIIKKYDTTEEWLAGREGKISGSKLKQVVTYRGNEVKMGVYQLIADALAVEPQEGSNRDRGHELEEEAIEHLSNATGHDFQTDLVMWLSDDDPDIAFSPDGFTKDLKYCAEAKCLGSARHVQIIIENRVPSDFKEQTIQAFIVNEKLQKLYFCSYDPRIVSHPLHVIEITRKDVEEDIEFYLEYQKKTLEFVREWVEKLSF